MSVPIDIRVPACISNMIERLERAGYEAYVVGGCVRDSLMGRVPSDWDMCTSAMPDETARVFSDRKILRIGEKHGTITVLVPEEACSGNGENAGVENGVVSGGAKAALKYDKVEITTFRTEGAYSDGRHPDRVSFVRNLTDDLARRDFTINAMAYSPSAGLVDPFGGQTDIDNWRLRAVGDPGERFREDALRIMRAMRFMATLGFRADKALHDAMISEKELLTRISNERIQTELMKLLTGSAAVEVLNEYRDVLAVFIPEILPMFGYDQHSPYHNRDVWHHTLAAVDDVPGEYPELRLTMLLHDIAKPVLGILDEGGRGHFMGHQRVGAEIAEKVLRRLRFSGAEVDTITQLIRYHDAKLWADFPSVRKWLGFLGREQFDRLLIIKHADAAGKYSTSLNEVERRNEEIRGIEDAVLRNGDCITVKQLAVSGRDLQEAGLVSGAGTGIMLEKLLDMVMNDEILNYRETLMEAGKMIASEKTRCIIFSGAPECYVPSGLDAEQAVVIACDRGYAHAKEAGFRVDIVLGDFDSYDGSIEGETEVIRLPAEKDDTDTHYAVRLAIERGLTDITILGAVGARLDHELANVQTCVYAAREKALCRIVDEHHEMFSLYCASRRIPRDSWKWLSVFAIDREIGGVTLRGLKYEIENEKLYNYFPRGVSNEFVADTAEVDVANGTMLVVLSDM
ncbi:MAG: thiamine diphosphokinase [Clostridia bacterium]|nr:thiamine diphosphokinase [Clostridia bacterium]